MDDLMCSACSHSKSLHFSIDGCHGVFRALRCECQEFKLDTSLWSKQELLDLRENIEVELRKYENVS